MFLGFVGDDLLKVNGGYFCIGLVFASWGYFCSCVMWTEGCKTKIIMTAQEWLSCGCSSCKRRATRCDVPWLCWWWSSESEWGLLLHWGCFCKLGLLLQFCYVNWRLQNKKHNDCPGVAILWRLLLEMEKGIHQVWCSLALLVMVFWKWIGVTVAFLFLRLSTVPERKAPPERRHSGGFRWLRSFGFLMFCWCYFCTKLSQLFLVSFFSMAVCPLKSMEVLVWRAWSWHLRSVSWKGDLFLQSSWGYCCSSSKCVSRHKSCESFLG